ncbi:MAG: Zn-dependent alcohol dehydrogenase [Chloroflexi bacterium]|nr:Zn-dependent alcohol dehydrogenase [Chloroflexota bacterium]
MKAAVLYEIGKPLVIEEVELDEPQENEILVKLEATGVCHSDLHFMQGAMPQPLPFVPGHEGAGIVEKVGPNVTSFKPGDHVILLVVIECGKCRFCLSGKPTLCVENLPIQMMATLPGGGVRLHKGDQPINHLFGLACFAEKVVVHERSAVKIRKDAPLDAVCLLGCGVSTGLGAAINVTRVKPGESIAIFGCGGVGMSAVMGAKSAGAKVIAIDTLDSKLEKAREFGADYIINASREDPEVKIPEILGEGADYAIEVIGNVDVIAKAFNCIRAGGLLVIAGMPAFTDMITVPAVQFLFGKTMTATIHGDIVAPVDIPRYVDLFMDGTFPIDKLITRTYRLDQINEAFEAMEKGEVIRSIIKM